MADLLNISPESAQGKFKNLSDSIPNPQEAIDSVQSKVTNKINEISGAISDPFGAIIQKILNRINSLIVNIEKKIDQLIQDIAKKTDSKGRVSIQGNQLVISITRADAQQAEELKARVQNKIQSIQNTITILRDLLTTLITIQTSINLYKNVLDAQEVILSTNPATKAAFDVLKKGVKIVFLKEILKQYLKLLAAQLLLNRQIVDKLLNRFRSLQVTVKIQDEADKGNFVSVDTAENLLADDLLGDADSQDFTDNNFNNYILKIEKYDQKQIIGRAYDKSSGLIKAQTAPSYFSGPEELLEELKTIINATT